MSTPRVIFMGTPGFAVGTLDALVAAGIEGVEFICANTDAQALKNTSARSVLQLGSIINFPISYLKSVS